MISVIIQVTVHRIQNEQKYWHVENAQKFTTFQRRFSQFTIPSKPTRYRFFAPLSHRTYAALRGLDALQSYKWYKQKRVLVYKPGDYKHYSFQLFCKTGLFYWSLQVRPDLQRSLKKNFWDCQTNGANFFTGQPFVTQPVVLRHWRKKHKMPTSQSTLKDKLMDFQGLLTTSFMTFEDSRTIQWQWNRLIYKGVCITAYI